MNPLNVPVLSAIDQVALNGYFIENRKDAASIAREFFPAVTVRWVYFRETRRLVMGLQASIELNEEAEMALLAKLEERLMKLPASAK